VAGHVRPPESFGDTEGSCLPAGISHKRPVTARVLGATAFSDTNDTPGYQCKISAIWRCFTLIFAFNILIVRHISTSGLFDLLT